MRRSGGLPLQTPSDWDLGRLDSLSGAGRKQADRGKDSSGKKR